MFQIENSAGKPATDGWLEVYIHGTREKYYCASNFDGTLHPFKIKLDSLGSNIVLADDGQAYDVYAYNRFGSLLMSRYNVQPGSGGSGSIITGEMQHWLGMYGPTYTHFPGDEAGHTLGIPRQSVDYDGDFIDHIETAPYPDGDVPAYIYLKPGLYHIDCVIRYQQDSGDIKNTLDEVLIYTGHGNANEDVAYQLDASGPDTNGNRHCLKQSFIRKVTENDGSLLYFAPGTPTDWTDAYIQTLSIVKLDSMIYGKAGIPKVTHDDTMTGDGTPDSPLSIQDALDGKQDTLTPGEGITIDSDGNISSETYSEGWGIDIDENNVISVDPDIIQQKLTPGDGIQIDSDGTITAEGEKYYEGWGIDINENNEISVDPDIIQKKITTGEGLELDSDGNLNLDLPPVKPLVAGDNITIVESEGSVVISAADAPVYTEGYGIDIDSDGRIGVDPNVIQEKLTAGEGITIDNDGTISVDPEVVQEKLTAGDNITIDSDGVISATDMSNIYWCRRGTTTYADAKAAYDAGKHLFMIDGARISPLAYASSGYLNFVYCSNAGSWGGPTIHRVSLASSYGWGEWSGTFQADWNSTDNYSPSFIRNKPNLDNYQKKLIPGEGIDLDSDGNISVDKETIQEKLTPGDGIEINSDGVITNTYEQVQADWEQNDDSQPDFIKNKPDLSEYQKALTAGEGIELDSDGNISLDLPPVKPLVAGDNITIVDSDNSVVISAAGGGSSYTAGTGIDITSDVISVDTSVVQEKLTAGQNITIDSDGVISAAGAPTYTAGNGISIDGNNEISVDTTVVQEKLTAGQNIEIDSDGTISAELPSEEEVQFEELDPSTYATKAEVTQGLAAKQDTLTAGQNIDIDSDGVISATSEPCLWFLDSDGKITPKDGKHFEVYGAPSYTQVGQYYFKKAAKVQSNDSGFEIDGLLASHTGSDTQYGNYGAVAKVYTEFAQDPYMGARRGGLIVKSFENSSVHPESRIEMYAGNDSGYGVENYKNKTYVQAVVGSDYVRMRSDDIIRHTGNSDSHAPFVSAQQSDTTKTYVMKPTSTAGVYDLVEESSGGGGGGTTYTAGQGIDITNDVISVDSDSVAMKSDLPSEEEVEFEEFNPENMTLQQKNAMARALGVDETVLWENYTFANNLSSNVVMSETPFNFSTVRITFSIESSSSSESYPTVQTQLIDMVALNSCLNKDFTLNGTIVSTSPNYGILCRCSRCQFNGTSITDIKSAQFYSESSAVITHALHIYRIVGIHRIANN